MSKTLKLWLLFLLAAIPCLGQTQTLVSGTLVDPNGVAYYPATVKACLNPSTLNPTVGGNPVNPNPGTPYCVGPTNTSTSGFFSMALWPNANIVPSSTTWIFQVSAIGTAPPAGNGPLNFQSAGVTVSGTTQDVSTNINSVGTAQVRAGGSGGTTPANTQFPSGMMAWYRILPTETAAALVDYSGNSRTATGTIGTACTIQADIGGLNCTGNGATTLPASLNTAKTLVAVIGFQQSSNSNTFNAPIMGNGNLAAANATGMILCNTLSASCQGATYFTQRTFWPFTFNSTGFTGNARAEINGIEMLSMTMDTTDHMYVGKTLVDFASTGSSSGIQTVGFYQLGGTAAGSGSATQTYFTGQIYEAAFFSGVLTANQIGIVRSLIFADLANRNVFPSVGITTSTDQLVCEGDSQMGDQGIAPIVIDPCDAMTLNGTWNVMNHGITASTMQQDFTFSGLWMLPLFQNPITTPATRRLALVMAGTNDFVLNGTTAAATWAYMAAEANDERFAANKVILTETISRQFTNFDTNFKDVFDPLVRQHCREVADGCVHLAVNPNLGADGAANAHPIYFIENPNGIHPTQHSNYNIISMAWAHAINSLYGNNDFSQATTYTVTTPVAVTVSAATESGNTATFTTTAHTFVVGQCALVAGVTPAGYNTGTNECTKVLTVPDNTHFTAWMSATGLGALSVAGTAIVPLEKDADMKAILGGSAAGPIYLLEPCWMHEMGIPMQLMAMNTNATPWVIQGFNGDLVNGSNTMNAPVASATNHPIVSLKPVAGSMSAGGCSWQASLQ